MKHVAYALTALLGAAAAAAVPPTSMSDADPRTMSHGDYAEVNGQTWRFQQLAQGVFHGVLPENWDDNVHVANDTKLEWPAMDEPSEPQTTANPARVLDRRGLKSTCKAGVSCLVVGSVKLWDWTGPLRTSLKTLGSNTWEGLNQPFLANFGGVGGQNLVVTLLTTYALNKSGKSEPPQDCSTTMSQEDLTNALIKKICDANPNASAFSVDIPYPDGSTRTLHINAGNGSTMSKSNVCGAPGIQ